MNTRNPVITHLAVLSSIAITNLRNVKGDILCPHCNKLLPKRPLRGLRHYILMMGLKAGQQWSSYKKVT